MPELPDLEVFKENIFKRLTSKKLTKVIVFSQKITTPQVVLEEELLGRELQSIIRHGKELWFDFADRRVISAHLMLNGNISIRENSSAKNIINNKVFALMFENESVVFHDTGSIGTVIKYKPFVGKAPDALGSDFTLEYFLTTARKNSLANIKAFLIDQKIIRGIGNAYADEILWHAKISPKSIAGQIPEKMLLDLHQAIGIVLQNAITSIKAISPDITSGEERSFLNVHNKLKKKTDAGFPILVEMVAGKKTYFTDEQVIYK